MMRQMKIEIDSDYEYIFSDDDLAGVPGLARAIMKRAFLDLDDDDKYARMAAWRWLFTEDRYFLFSLPLCCEILNFDINEFRKKVFQYV